MADENLTNSTRKAVATALDNTQHQLGCFLLGKPKQPVPSATSDKFWENVKDGEELNTLSKLIGPRSWTLPNMLELSEDEMIWLKQDVSDWKLFPGYQKFYNFIYSLKVVNDTAERGVKLIQEFIKSSNNEDLRQDFMMAVSAVRKQLPLNKMTKKPREFVLKLQ